MRLSYLLTAGVALSTAAASAQTAIIRDENPLPSDPALTVTSIGGVATNQAGGFAVQVDVNDGTNTLDGAWGSYAGGAGTLLRTEGTFAGFIQGNYETTIALSANAVIYSPSCESIATGSTGLDSIWVGDTPIAVEEEPFPMSTLFWRFGSRPRTTEAGVPAFVGGLTDTQGGSTTERAFFLGTTPLYRTGDNVPGAPAPLSSTAVDFDSKISANGTNNIALLDADTGSSSDDGVMAMNGMAMMLGGAIVRESLPLPAAVGGLAGENWDNFDYMGITEAGNYAFSGDTDGSTDTDEFIVRDGVIVHREGDTLDGEILAGSIELLYLSENNELAFVWDIENPAGSDLEALYFEGALLLREGDEVDWDGDGTIDAGFVVTDFNSTETLAIDSNGVVYVSADIDTNGGGNLEAILAFGDGSLGTNYCTALPNSTGSPASIVATGSAAAMSNSVTLSASGLPAQQFGIFLASQTQDLVPTFDGNLCLGGSIGRYNQPAQILVVDMNGEFSLALDLTLTPQPNSFVSIAAGETWNFQGWYRDSNMTGSTANFTDAVSIPFN